MRKIIDWESIPLGEGPDSLFATELGVAISTVRRRRIKLGISPFAGLLLTQEGVPCRSRYEGMYDSYLHWKNIYHEHEVKVESLPYRADFKTQDGYIEIAGMMSYKKYALKYETKRAAYKKANIAVKWLFTDDVEALYKDCPIKIKLCTGRICFKCGKEEYDLALGLCSCCYMTVWREKTGQNTTCVLCSTNFKKVKSSKQRFCSYSCYWRSRRLDWPSWKWLLEEMEGKSIRQIAFGLKIKPGALYMHIRRARERGVIS